MTTLSATIRDRRMKLRISQADLGWISRTSRNTVSNLERELVDPEPDTIADIASALGLEIRLGEGGEQHIREVVAEDITQRLLELVIEAKSADGTAARNAADMYTSIVRMKTYGHKQTKSEILANVNFLVESIAPAIDPNEVINSQILKWFESLGWTPEDNEKARWGEARRQASQQATSDDDVDRAVGATEAAQNAALGQLRGKVDPSGQAEGVFNQLLSEQLYKAHTETRNAQTLTKIAEHRVAELERNIVELNVRLDEHRAKAEAFGRLPNEIKEALMRGFIVDADITRPTGATSTSFSSMLIRQEEPAFTMTADDRRVLIHSMYVWHLSMDLATHLFKHFQDEKWLPPDELKEHIEKTAESLAAIANSRQAGLLGEAKAEGRYAEQSENSPVGAAKTRADHDQFSSFQEEARFFWERQLEAVRGMRDRGDSVEAIATALGESPDFVEEMLKNHGWWPQRATRERDQESSRAREP